MEAIKALKRLFNTYELDLPCTDSLDVLHKSIEALEKQISKKPKIMNAPVGKEKVWWYCGHCGASKNTDSKVKYCDHCGGKVDWD
jgi:hypothetical protein